MPLNRETKPKWFSQQVLNVKATANKMIIHGLVRYKFNVLTII